MNKQEFLKKIIQLYDDFNEKNKLPRIEAYNIILIGDIDYSRLFVKLIQTYQSLSFAPSPAILYGIVEEFRREKERLRYEKERAKQEEQERIKREQEEIAKQKVQEPLTIEEIERIKEIQQSIRNFKFKGIENE